MSEAATSPACQVEGMPLHFAPRAVLRTRACAGMCWLAHPLPCLCRALPPAGAPHNVDEAAAIWFGTLCPAGNVADVATKRAKTFGTMVDAGDSTCIA